MPLYLCGEWWNWQNCHQSRRVQSADWLQAVQQLPAFRPHLSIATKSDWNRRTKPLHQRAATARCNIPQLQRLQFRQTGTTGSQIPTGSSAASTLFKPKMTYATAPKGIPETSAPKDWLGKTPESAPKKNISDEDVVTFMTTEQQIIMTLKTAQTDVMMAVYWLVMRTRLYMQQFAPIGHTWPLFSSERRFRSLEKLQISPARHNFVNSPGRAQNQNNTGLMRGLPQYSSYSSILRMDAALLSETSVNIYRTMWRHIPVTTVGTSNLTLQA